MYNSMGELNQARVIRTRPSAIGAAGPDNGIRKRVLLRMS
jgi:hypothetical protein